MSVEQYQVLSWDSQWFGIPIGRVDIPELTIATAAKVDAWAEAEGLRCVYVFAEIEMRAADLTDSFEPMGVRLEYKLDPLVLAENSVEEADFMRPGELELVCELARQLFTETRFSRDSRFPVSLTRELYAEWVRKESTGQVPGCIVIRKHAEILGFITGRVDQTNLDRGLIGLLGVTESFRGSGLGRRLLVQMCRAFIKNGVKRVSVVTQGDNMAACRLYESGGRVNSHGFWYHRWYGEDNSRKAALQEGCI